MEQKYQGTLQERRRQASLDYYYRNQSKCLKYRKLYYKKNKVAILLKIHAGKIPCPRCGGLMRPESKLCDTCAHPYKYSGTLKERKAAAVRALYRRDPHRFMQHNIKRRAITHSAQGNHTHQEWISLCEKYDCRCLCCGEHKSLCRDHIVPLSKGGTNYIENIQPLCKSCNSHKRTKTIDYRGLVN